MGLVSSSLDTVTYFIIRRLGTQVPSAIIPFITGIFSSVSVIIYCFIFYPFDFKLFVRDESDFDSEETLKNQDYRSAVILAFMGCFFGWLALEANIFGLRISKSAIASYAE